MTALVFRKHSQREPIPQTGCTASHRSPLAGVRRSVGVGGATTLLVLAGAAPSSPRLRSFTPSSTPQPSAYIRTSRALTGVEARTGVIVRLSPGVRSSDLRPTITRLGGIVYRDLPLIGAIAVRLPETSHRTLAALPGVAHLSPDLPVRKTDEFTVGHTGAELAARPAPTGFGLTGKGVGIAVLDTGISDHPDFTDARGASRILAETAFGADLAADECGHGTHVAGILAGNGARSTGRNCFRTFRGIAPRAHLINVRVLDRNGVGAVSDVISGIEWIIAHRERWNIRVVNLSLGHPVYESAETDPLNRAVRAAWKAGLVVVCAAGNDGRLSDEPMYSDNEGYGTRYASIACPGNDPYVITVGATKRTDNNPAHDRIASYSGRGPSRQDMTLKPDLVAPGNRVISVLAPRSSFERIYAVTNGVPHASYSRSRTSPGSPDYFALSGTSMAAPVVAGAVALMLEKDPTLTPDTVKARLMISADRRTASADPETVLAYGAGHLNIPAALRCAAQADPGFRSLKVEVSPDGDLRLARRRTPASKNEFRAAQAIWGKGDKRIALPLAALRDALPERLPPGRATTGRVDLGAIALAGE
ncbi:MAG: S8 family peptidase [Capsulimonadales bacterium]|nr:S8 family peptidase [Capsulimonadales bacterium]